MKSRSLQCLVCVLIAAAFLLPVSVLGGSAVGKAKAEKDWTIMMYWDADNSLEFCTEFAMTTWEASLPSNAHINIVALVDLLSVDGIWIYDIVGGQRHVVAEWPEMNTSDPAVMVKFVEYSMAKFPAKQTMLVLQDHGYGWRGICQDETNGDVLMSMDGMAAGLRYLKAEMGRPVDILAFDACNMASLEGFYELRGSVNYVVASETMVPFDGLPYQMFISDLVANPGLSAADLAKNIVNEYVLYYSSKWDYPHIMTYSQDFATMVAVDMSKMEAVGDAFVSFAAALQPIISDHLKEIQVARGYALIGTWTNMAGYEWMPDVFTFMEGLRSIPGHPELTSAIDAFGIALEQATLAQASSKKYHDTTHGLNFWFPPSLAQYNAMGWAWARQFVYADVGLDLAAESAWIDCLMAYYAA